jgi:hypothetical protein
VTDESQLEPPAPEPIDLVVRRARPPLLARAAAMSMPLVVIIIDVIIIDQITGRHLANQAGLMVRRIRWALTDKPYEIAPRDISAMHNEVRRILEEAARANPSP